MLKFSILLLQLFLLKEVQRGPNACLKVLTLEIFDRYRALVFLLHRSRLLLCEGASLLASLLEQALVLH